jgi:hypothetical protein
VRLAGRQRDREKPACSARTFERDHTRLTVTAVRRERGWLGSKKLLIILRFNAAGRGMVPPIMLALLWRPSSCYPRLTFWPGELDPAPV